MDTTIINNELSITYPYDYIVMEKDPTIPARFESLELQDKKHHVIISVMCMTSDSMLFSLGREKSLLKQIESSVSGSNEYEKTGTLKTILCEKEVNGFSYQFTINEVVQHAQVFAVKSKKAIYSVTIYARDPEKFSSELVLDVLKSIRYLSEEEIKARLVKLKEEAEENKLKEI